MEARIGYFFSLSVYALQLIVFCVKHRLRGIKDRCKLFFVCLYVYVFNLICLTCLISLNKYQTRVSCN